MICLMIVIASPSILSSSSTPLPFCPSSSFVSSFQENRGGRVVSWKKAKIETETDTVDQTKKSVRQRQRHLQYDLKQRMSGVTRVWRGCVFECKEGMQEEREEARHDCCTHTHSQKARRTTLPCKCRCRCRDVQGFKEELHHHPASPSLFVVVFSLSLAMN